MNRILPKDRAFHDRIRTTTFRMMCGLLTPTSGTARVMGIDLRKSPSAARQHLGYMAQKFSLYGSLSVGQNLRFFSGAYGLLGERQVAAITAMIEVFRIRDVLSTGLGSPAESAVIRTAPTRFAGLAVAEHITLDGHKYLLEDGSWVCFRPSGTQPVVRFYLESSSLEGLAKLRQAGDALLQGA